MKKLIPFFIIACMLPLSLVAQERIIKGKITSSVDDMPHAEVTITNQNSKKRSVSNIEGDFEVSAANNDVLIFSHVGFLSTKILITKNTKVLNVVIHPNAQVLSDVVVTGALGIKKEGRALGTSATVMDNQLLNQASVINPLNGLASKVAGLRINVMDSKVDPQIQITLRGNRSFNGSKNQPMYVLDGVPVPDISRLNPNDFESITVLKGANAAALYGYEGVNGAIMITTKTGKNGITKVQFNSTTTFSNVMLLPPAQNKFGQGTNGKYDPVQFESWGPAFDNSTQDFGKPLPDGSQPTISYSAPNKDARLQLFQTGVTTQNDISFSGGSKNNSYFLSGQYIHSNGVIPEDKNQRINLRFNGSQKTGKLKTSYNTSYSNTQNTFAPDGPWVTAYQLPANFPYEKMKDWRNPNSIAYANNFFTDQAKNPFFQIGNYRNSTSGQFPPTAQNTLNAKVEFNYDFNRHFSVLYRLGTYQNFTDYRATVGKFETTGRRNVNGSVQDRNHYFGRWNNDLILNFKQKVKDFGFNVLAGYNVRMDYQKDLSIGSNNLLVPDLFNQGTRIGELNGGSTITQYRSYSPYGELGTSYKNWLYLTFTVRNDNVSVLAPENRSYFYPGVSLSFVLSDAIPALKKQTWLSFAKVYNSFNKTGNVTLNPYNLNNSYTQTSGFPFGNLGGFSPSTTNANPNIKPEFVTSYEAGLQLGLFKNRLNIDATYVFSKSSGQIFNAPQSSATGYLNAYVNSGSLTNKILEFTISGEAVKTANNALTLNATFSRINNSVESLYGDLQQYQIFRQSYAVKGLPYPTLQVSDYERNPQGAVVVNDKGEPVVSKTPVNLGTTVPPYMAGLGVQFQHRNFNIGLQFDSRWGSWLYSEIIPRMYNAGTHPATAAYNREPFVWPNSVTKTTNADGSVAYTENNTEIKDGGQRSFWSKQGAVQRNTAAKGDYMKLREVNIGYTLPQKWISKMGAISAAKISFVANNLLLIRHKSNTMGDPEYLYNNTNGYLSFRQVPPLRTYGFNINVTF